jgi:hypothetical protein
MLETQVETETNNSMEDSNNRESSYITDFNKKTTEEHISRRPDSRKGDKGNSRECQQQQGHQNRWKHQ